MIPVRDKNTNIDSQVAKGKKLKKKLDRWSEEVAERFITDDIPLDEGIAEFARSESLTEAMIQRMVEEVNILAYNKIYKQYKHSNDRRFTFPVASLSGVLESLGDEAPEKMTNPNLATGKAGEGEMKKSASENIEPSYIHNPHRSAASRYEKQMEKVASSNEQKKKESIEKREKEFKSSIFKVAHTLVQSERIFKNANTLYNTLIDSADIGEAVEQDIQTDMDKIASELKKQGKVPQSFSVKIERDSLKKVAKPLLGEHSLIKTASSDEKKLKVRGANDISSFDDLESLFHTLT